MTVKKRIPVGIERMAWNGVAVSNFGRTMKTVKGGKIESRGSIPSFFCVSFDRTGCWRFLRTWWQVLEMVANVGNGGKYWRTSVDGYYAYICLKGPYDVIASPVAVTARVVTGQSGVAVNRDW